MRNFWLTQAGESKKPGKVQASAAFIFSLGGKKSVRWQGGKPGKGGGAENGAPRKKKNQTVKKKNHNKKQPPPTLLNSKQPNNNKKKTPESLIQSVVKGKCGGNK